MCTVFRKILKNGRIEAIYRVTAQKFLSVCTLYLVVYCSNVWFKSKMLLLGILFILVWLQKTNFLVKQLVITKFMPKLHEIEHLTFLRLFFFELFIKEKLLYTYICFSFSLVGNTLSRYSTINLQRCSVERRAGSKRMRTIHHTASYYTVG